jgi:deazaflavin-dependent oxidoreductase (nitroreductase family)
MTDTSNMNDWNAQIIKEFRENGGKVGGQFEGAPLVLLTTTGAKSGQPRVAPLVSLQDGDRTVIFASKAGADTNPDWYHNIRANPRVQVEQGTETYAANAVEVTGAERDRIFDRQKQAFPGFADYEASTDRVIPVIALERVG